MQLKAIRKQRKIRAEDLAERLGISIWTIRGYESGKREPDIPTLIKLADELECTIDDLVGRKKKGVIRNDSGRSRGSKN